MVNQGIFKKTIKNVASQAILSSIEEGTYTFLQKNEIGGQYDSVGATCFLRKCYPFNAYYGILVPYKSFLSLLDGNLSQMKVQQYLTIGKNYPMNINIKEDSLFYYKKYKLESQINESLSIHFDERMFFNNDFHRLQFLLGVEKKIKDYKMSKSIIEDKRKFAAFLESKIPSGQHVLRFIR